jgi:hypothetical protein
VARADLDGVRAGRHLDEDLFGGQRAHQGSRDGDRMVG